MYNIIPKDEIDKMVLYCIKNWEEGYWHGWERLGEEIQFFFNKELQVAEIKLSIKRLVKANAIECVPIFDESNLKLKGKGYIVKRIKNKE